MCRVCEVARRGSRWVAPETRAKLPEPVSSFYRQVILASQDFNQIARDYVNQGNPEAWYQAFSDRLTEAHARGAWHGAWLASPSDRAPEFGDDYMQIGRLMQQNESVWLLNFRAALQDDPEMNEDQIARRMNLYLGRVQGTANQAFIDFSPPETLFYWQRNATESCDDCVYFESLGVRQAQEFPTSPRANDTRCLMNCQCEWIREPGTANETSGFGAMRLWLDDENGDDGD